MALGYLLSPALQVENINGKPLVGGTITVYRHGTTNPYITYKDFTGDRNPADVVLNNKGMAVILADPNLVYDVYCRDADGVEQWSRLNVTVADPIGAGDGRIYNITSEDGSITSTSSVDVQTGVTTFDLSVTNPARDYTTRGNWDRSIQIDNSAHTISGDMQCVAIRQQINNDPSTNKYAKVCEADINTVTWINEWATTLQLSFQSSGAYYKGKSTGIFSLNMENYVTHSGYQQEHEEDGKWLLWDGDNKSPGLVKLRLYWRDDSSSQHYELWAETSNLKYFETLVAQALVNCSMRNHLTSSLPIEQERNIWRFNSIGIETLKPSLPTGMQLVGSWEPSNASIKPQEDHGVYYVEYGTTTFADAEAAYLAGKTLVCREIGQTVQQTRMDDLYFLIDYMPTAGTYTGHFVFSNISGYIQNSVVLSPSATYEKNWITLTTHQEAMDTLAAEIAPDYMAVVNEYTTEDKFPIPAGTIVTYLDNTSSSVLQYLYKSKVAIERSDAYTSDPISAPQKWDRIHVADELGKGVAYVDVLQTPFADVLALYNQGKFIVGRNGYDFYRMTGYSESWGTIDLFSFQSISGPVVMTWYVRSDGPSETNNWVTPPSIYYNASIYNIATPYDETSTYSEGDVVSRYDTLYRCNTDISVAEQWTPAHWTQTTVAAELADIRSGMSGDKVFHAVYGTTTFAEITDAVTAGKLVFLTGVTGSSDTVYSLTTYTSPRPSMAIFHAAIGNTVYMAKIDSGTWSTGSTTLATSADLANYQEKLTAGSNITIDANNVISATAAPQQQADWNQTDTSAPDYIKNKPDVDDVVILNYGTATLSQIGAAVNAGKCVIVGRTVGGFDYYGYLIEYGSGAYTFVYKDGNYLVSMKIQPDGGDGTWSMSSVNIPAAQIQSDWAQSDSSAVDYIKNKPDLGVYATTADLSTGLAAKQDVISDLATIRSGAAAGATAVQPGDLATVATTGDYADLSNKPTIRNVPASTVSDADKVLTVGSTGEPYWADPSAGLFEAVYGQTSYADIVAAINAHKIVYCRISATGASRMAFLAYIGNGNAEFQYYRSLSSHSASNQTDEVYVYTVSSTGWTTNTRLTGIKYAAGTHMTSSFAKNTLTFQSVWPDVDQTYDGTSTNAQSGTAVAGALATKEDAFNVGTGLKMDTSGSTPTLQADETVLWTGSLGATGSSQSLSESIYNFNAIEIHCWPNKSLTTQRAAQVSKFTLGTSQVTAFFYCKTQNLESGTYYSEVIYVNVSNGTSFQLAQGHRWQDNTQTKSIDDYRGAVCKIVGIHRIASN